MRNLMGVIYKRVNVLFVAAGLFTLTPSAGYGGLLGTTVDGTLTVGVGTTNYFDLSAVPGSAPVSATVVIPSVEFPGNQPALQADLGVTTHISADLADHEVLLTWINSGLASVAIPKMVFTFGLNPSGGQSIASFVFDLGLPPDSLIFGPNSAIITYNGFILGAAQSTFAHFTLSFVNVPEPSTYLLLGSMALIVLFAARRNRQAMTCKQDL